MKADPTSPISVCDPGVDVGNSLDLTLGPKWEDVDVRDSLDSRSGQSGRMWTSETRLATLGPKCEDQDTALGPAWGRESDEFDVHDPLSLSDSDPEDDPLQHFVAVIERKRRKSHDVAKGLERHRARQVASVMLLPLLVVGLALACLALSEGALAVSSEWEARPQEEPTSPAGPSPRTYRCSLGNLMCYLDAALFRQADKPPSSLAPPATSAVEGEPSSISSYIVALVLTMEAAMLLVSVPLGRDVLH